MADQEEGIPAPHLPLPQCKHHKLHRCLKEKKDKGRIGNKIERKQ